MIVAAVLAAVVVIAAIVVTLVVTTGDDAEQADDDQTSSAPSSDPTDEPSADEPSADEPSADEPSSEPTTDPPVDVPRDAIVGDGYYFELPATGWQDALAEAQQTELGGGIDAIIILGSSLNLAQSNILVEALTAGGAPDLEALEDQWKRNLSGDDGAVPEDIPEITIDGERAIGARFTDRENVNGFVIDQVIYLAIHEGNQYSVALTLPAENDAVSEADFEKVLDSWTWTD